MGPADVDSEEETYSYSTVLETNDWMKEATIEVRIVSSFTDDLQQTGQQLQAKERHHCNCIISESSAIAARSVHRQGRSSARVTTQRQNQNGDRIQERNSLSTEQATTESN